MILLDLAAILILVGVVYGVVSVVSWSRTRLDNNRVSVRDLRKQLSDTEKTLRHIANGQSGNPALEASIALDEIERFHETKEIS